MCGIRHRQMNFQETDSICRIQHNQINLHGTDGIFRIHHAQMNQQVLMGFDASNMAR